MIRSRLLWAVVALGAVAVFHPGILRSCAWLLIVDRRDTAVERLVIAGGDGRFDVAAAWVREDPQRRIVLIQGRPERVVELGILPAGEAVARRELAKRQVPEERIELISVGDRKDGDPLCLLAAWMEEHPDLRTAVLCERFASRGLRLRIDAAATRAVAGRIDTWALPDRRYDEHNWWRSRTGVRQLVLNSIALAYTWCQNGSDHAPETLNVEQYEALVEGREGR
jgi:hypothetical protein